MSNEIVETYLNDMFTPAEIQKYPDLQIALEYLLLKDSTPKLTMDEITDQLNHKYPSFPSSRQGAYYRVDRWKQDGTFRQAETLYLTPKIEEMRAAIGRAVTALPDIIDKLIKDGLETKSVKDRLAVTTYLVELSQGQVDKVNEPGDLERGYLASVRSHNPQDIVPED
jgi:hypothetical protein